LPRHAQACSTAIYITLIDLKDTEMSAWQNGQEPNRVSNTRLLSGRDPSHSARQATWKTRPQDFPEQLLLGSAPENIQDSRCNNKHVGEVGYSVGTWAQPLQNYLIQWTITDKLGTTAQLAEQAAAPASCNLLVPPCGTTRINDHTDCLSPSLQMMPAKMHVQTTRCLHSTNTLATALLRIKSCKYADLINA